MMMTVETRLGPELKKLQGGRIKAARVFAGLSQGDLAYGVTKLTGEPISRNIISEIEIGERDVKVREIKAIAILTEQDQKWLEGDSGAVGVFDEPRNAKILVADSRLIPFPVVGLPTQSGPLLALAS